MEPLRVGPRAQPSPWYARAFVGFGVLGFAFGGSWDLVSQVISTLIGVVSIVALIITLVTKSHDPLSKGFVELCFEHRSGFVTAGLGFQKTGLWAFGSRW